MKNSKLKMLRRCLSVFVVALILVLALTAPASALEIQTQPYDSYTIWTGYGSMITASQRPAYEYMTTINGHSLDISSFKEAFDICTDKEGNVYNINADTAASYIAGAMKAERLITMTDIPGILRDVNDPDSLIKRVNIKEARQLFADGIVTGGMIPKVECCIDAINMGVERVTILDGRVPHALLLETLTDEGAGTMVVKDKSEAGL